MVIECYNAGIPRRFGVWGFMVVIWSCSAHVAHFSDVGHIGPTFENNSNQQTAMVVAQRYPPRRLSFPSDQFGHAFGARYLLAVNSGPCQLDLSWWSIPRHCQMLLASNQDQPLPTSVDFTLATPWGPHSHCASVAPPDVHRWVPTWGTWHGDNQLGPGGAGKPAGKFPTKLRGIATLINETIGHLWGDDRSFQENSWEFLGFADG